MNLDTIDWQMIGTVVAALAFIYGLHRNSKKDRKEQFSELRKDISEVPSELRKDISDIRNDHLILSRNIGSDMSDIKERLAFLESAAIYTMPIESPQINPRSQAAREMWKRRKAKKLEKKE